MFRNTSVKSFINKRIMSNSMKMEVYAKLSPILTDVSLRDGIQGANLFDYPTDQKKVLFDHILTQYIPSNMEIGSFVSPKILPIMEDTPEIIAYSKMYLSSYPQYKSNMYVLVPSPLKLELALNHGITHFSFITSVSDDFQLKNAKKTVKETTGSLADMLNILNNVKMYSKFNHHAKLYVSCISECPLAGQIPLSKIIPDIVYYSCMGFDEICLSDTCGSLSPETFNELLHELLEYKINPNKLSLHLHVKNTEERRTAVKKILFDCFENGIRRFDVSHLSTGGCKVTLNASQMLPNLSYELFYETLNEYCEYKTN